MGVNGLCGAVRVFFVVAILDEELHDLLLSKGFLVVSFKRQGHGEEAEMPF